MNLRTFVRLLATVFTTLVMIVLFPWVGQCQEPLWQDQSQQADPNTLLNDQQQQAMQEILQIRERLGGGLGEQLQDVFGASGVNSGASSFGESLQRVMRAPQPAEYSSSQKMAVNSLKQGLMLSRPILCQFSHLSVSPDRGDRVDLFAMDGAKLNDASKEPFISSIEIGSLEQAQAPASKTGAVRFWVTSDQNEQLNQCRFPVLLEFSETQNSVPSSDLAWPDRLPRVGLQRQAPGRAPSTSRFSGSKMEQFRQVARDLERVAADLEDLELYKDADALRLKSQQLWSMARRKSATTDIMQR